MTRRRGKDWDPERWWREGDRCTVCRDPLTHGNAMRRPREGGGVELVCVTCVVHNRTV